MENATKALLIAAAVLVAILIISLGLVVYNMASETIDSVNFSGQEVTAFNDKFEHYEGVKVKGSEVNAMLKTVLNSNMQSYSEGLDPNATDDHPKFVEVEGIGEKITPETKSLGSRQASSSQLYNIEVERNTTTGFVWLIKVSEWSEGDGE